jgi:hypothetical protein
MAVVQDHRNNEHEGVGEEGDKKIQPFGGGNQIPLPRSKIRNSFLIKSGVNRLYSFVNG